MKRISFLLLAALAVTACDDDDDSTPTEDATSADANTADANTADANTADANSHDANSDAAVEDANTADADTEDSGHEDGGHEDGGPDECAVLCGGSTPYCYEGNCVQCVNSDQCGDTADCVSNRCVEQLTCDRSGFTAASDELRILSDDGLAYNAYTSDPSASATFDNLRLLLMYPESLTAASYVIGEPAYEQDFATCERCILAFENCTEPNICEKTYMATQGLMEVEQMGTQVYQEVKVKLSDLKLQEVNIAQNLHSTILESGQTWCIDTYNITKRINSESAECLEDTECTAPTPFCDNGACVECKGTEGCALDEVCKNNQCIFAALEQWKCDLSYYDDGDCDCGCGALDIDCVNGSSDLCNGYIPAGCVVVPDQNWLCAPDCTEATASSVCPSSLPYCANSQCAVCSRNEHCPGDQQCFNGHCGNCSEHEDCDEGLCLAGQCVSGWTCNEDYYGDNDCDCACGALDIDCVNGSSATCAYVHNECVAVIDGQNWLCKPDCTEATASEDCSSEKPYCANNVCVQCANDTHCASETPHCANNVCVQCTDDPHCPGGHCQNQRCIADGDCSFSGYPYQDITYSPYFNGHALTFYANNTGNERLQLEIYKEDLTTGVDYALGEDNYLSSELPILIYDACDHRGCTYYYGTDGTIRFTQYNSNRIAGSLSGLVFQEASIDFTTFESELIEDGASWCVDQLDFDINLAAD